MGTSLIDTFAGGVGCESECGMSDSDGLVGAAKRGGDDLTTSDLASPFESTGKSGC